MIVPHGVAILIVQGEAGRHVWRVVAEADIAAQGGRTVKIPTVRQLARRRRAIQREIARYKREASGLARALRSGAIGLDDWLVAMQAAVKETHIAAMIIAKGGDRALLTFADWGRVGGRLRGQYRYLRRYAAAIQEKALAAVASGGVVPFYSEKYLAWRAGLYGGASRGTFYSGMTEGLLDQVPGDGQTQCLTSCQCELRFDETDTPGLIFVFWELRPAEHCDDCVSLASEWRPLELWLPGAEIPGIEIEEAGGI